MRLKKAIYFTNALNRLLAGLAILTIGILVIILQNEILIPLMYVIAAVLIITGVAHLIGWCTQKPRKTSPLLFSLFSIVFGCVFIANIHLPLTLATVLFAVYLIVSGVAKSIDAILIFNSGAGEFLLSLTMALLFLVFGVMLLVTPSAHVNTVFRIFGLYCILFGSTYILDFIYSVLPKKAVLKAKRRIHITLPVFMVMFIPYTVQKKINTFLSSGSSLEELEMKLEEEGEEPVESIVPDLEIFIHVADNGANAIGHCDVCFEGEVIAYGNYDEASARLMSGIGPGVLILSHADTYIPFCLEHNHTTIFAFGLRLNEDQKQRVHTRIAEIKALLEPWDPPFQAAVKKDPQADPERFQDFSSILGRCTDTKFFKFTSSKFKTYFVCTTNCVLLVDSIVCKAGTDVLNVTGIVTPGTLYDYLNSEYLRSNSLVVTRDIFKMRNGVVEKLHISKE